MERAVFLDRDGTINEEMGYINHLDRFVLLPGAAAAVRSVNARGLKAVVVTNQSGAARGYFPVAFIDRVHEKMRRLLGEEGAFLDGIYTCPHSPQLREGEAGCDCRKPRPGLLLRAARDLSLDLAGSYVVGDRFQDVVMARSVGARAVLVLTGYGRGELEFVEPTSPVKPDFVAADLPQAVELILADLTTRGPER